MYDHNMSCAGAFFRLVNHDEKGSSTSPVHTFDSVQADHDHDANDKDGDGRTPVPLVLSHRVLLAQRRVPACVGRDDSMLATSLIAWKVEHGLL